MFTIKSTNDIKNAIKMKQEADKKLDYLLEKLYKLLSVPKLPYRPELLTFNKYEYHLETDIAIEAETNGYYFKTFYRNPIIVYSFDNSKLKPKIKELINEDEEVFFFVEFGEILFAGPVLCKRNGNRIKPIKLQIKEGQTNPLHYHLITDKFRDYYLYAEAVFCGRDVISFENPTWENQGFLRLLKDDTLEFDEEKTKSVLKDIEAVMDRCLGLYFDI